MNKNQKGDKNDHIWRALFPVVLYILISLMVEMLIGICFLIKSTHGNTNQSEEKDYFHSFSQTLNHVETQYGYFITFLSAFIAAFVFYFVFKEECKKNDGFSHAYHLKQMKRRNLVKVILLGGTAGPGLSRLLSLIRIKSILEDYEKVSSTLLNGPVILQIISLTIIVPVTEELIYRGVVYLRLRKELGRKTGMVITSLVFGLFHFNLLQGMYAFLLSFLLLFVFEKYRTIIACILLHGTANMIAVVSRTFALFDIANKNMVVYLVFMIVELITAAALLLSFRDEKNI